MDGLMVWRVALSLFLAVIALISAQQNSSVRPRGLFGSPFQFSLQYIPHVDMSMQGNVR